MSNWGEILIAVIGAGGLTQLLNYVRNTKRDGSKARAADLKRSDELTMQMWVEITKEQRDWRDTMRQHIDRLQIKVDDLQVENAQLLKRVAELEGRNADLQQENDELELRVKELERELRAANTVEDVA